MTGRRTFGIGLVLVAALIVLGVTAETAQAAPDRLEIGNATAGTGEEATVRLVASDLANPIGAWTVDVTHDGSLVELTDCEGLNGSACGPLFGPETTRITGASAEALEGVVVLAELTYRCGDEAGTSELSLSVEAWGSAIPEDPQPEVELINGNFNCVPIVIDDFPTPTEPIILPETGAGPTGGGSAIVWIAGALALAGAASVGAWTLRRERG